MSRREKENFVLCLVSAVLLAAVVIAGYHALTHEPKAAVYDAVSRADLTGFIKNSVAK